MAGEARLARRKRLLWFIGIVAVVVLAIGGYAWRHHRSSGPPDPRLVQIQSFLDTERANQPWYPAVSRLELKGDKLYVHTNLPGWNQATPINETSNFHISRPMYETLWKYASMDHPNWRIGWVYIMSRYGTYIDGGSA